MANNDYREPSGFRTTNARSHPSCSRIADIKFPRGMPFNDQSRGSERKCVRDLHLGGLLLSCS
jgi:hypothetical protein